MSKIKISMSQINTIVGSLDSNTKKIIDKITKAKKEKSNVICFPELSITGYPPEDLVLSDLFIKNNIQALNSIKKHTKNIFFLYFFFYLQELLFFSYQKGIGPLEKSYPLEAF